MPTPTLSLEQLHALVATHYGLAGTLTPLPGERDQNLRLVTDNGERFVLKVANTAEDRGFLDAQCAALEAAQPLGFCPTVVPSRSGERLLTIEGHLIRLVTYLAGTPLAHRTYRSAALLIAFGRRLGELDSALQPLDHPALHRPFYWDLAQGLAVVGERLHRIADPAWRTTIADLAERVAERLTPLLPQLRTSAIHNDANDHNVLVSGEGVVGLIDFGDMVHSHTVNELAIAGAYALLDQPDPLATLTALTKGYHSTFPLTEPELAALFPLILLRLCTSAAIAAEQQAADPDNAYLGISQAPIRRTLPMLAALPWPLAEAALRAACDLPTHPNTATVTAWLAAQQPAPIVAGQTEAVVLDLSIGSPLVAGDPAHNTASALGPRLEAALTEATATLGIGRYDEPRYLYTAPAFATGTALTAETRTIHLGMDLFAPAGTELYAPLTGTIHTIADNAAPQDYGPLLIVEHATADGIPFYSLYGHLSRESLTRWEVGQSVAAGAPLAAIGAADVNGGWPPHLHLQLAVDLLGLGSAFPGVAAPSQRALWTHLCPDPNLLLRLPATHFPPPAPHPAATLAHRRERLGRNLSIAYRDPVKLVRGWKQYLFDDDGLRYIDAYNNVAHVGHCHPRVVAAAQRQLGVLNTNTRYLHDTVLKYADALTALLPEPLRVCYFVSSGSEANELALRLAHTATRQRDTLVLDAAYHGNTNTLIEISPYKHNGPGGEGTPSWVHPLPLPDRYRGPHGYACPDAGPRYAAAVGTVLESLAVAGRGPMAFIAESLPSVGGQLILPPGYLDTVYRQVRAAGGVCIADEVQTGFGRIGTHFWGFEPQGVIPDIVVLGKPIGNGHPLGAVITTPAIAAAFDNGMEYFATFGGNPVSCAIGLEVLRVVQDEGLQAHAHVVGEQLLAALAPLTERFPLVGDVRGAGLFLGVELVRDRETKAPAATEASWVANRLRERGILLGTDGPFHNVVKIRPPMPFDSANADFLVAVLTQALEELSER